MFILLLKRKEKIIKKILYSQYDVRKYINNTTCARPDVSANYLSFPRPMRRELCLYTARRSPSLAVYIIIIMISYILIAMRNGFRIYGTLQFPRFTARVKIHR